MNISIFGMGYVGVVSAACLAKAGHRVLGVDVNEEKVRLLGLGRSPIVEKDVAPLVLDAVNRGLLLATSDGERAVAESEIVMITIGTPSRRNGSLDTSFIESAADAIGKALQKKREPTLIVLRSTVTPGTTEETLLPLLEAASGKKAGTAFRLAYQPEFLREGNAVFDFNHPAKIVVGASETAVTEKVLSLYQGTEAPRFHTDIRTAEMVKYADNAFHAVKITFANEIGLLCKRLGVATDRVMEIFKGDRKLNISEAYLTPGFAFGGSCLPKDLRALTCLGKMIGLETPLLSSVLPSNNAQIIFAVKKILSYGKKTIGIAGLSFKAETDDLRESPLVEIAEILAGKGLSLFIYDSSVTPDNLLGVNREYLRRHLPRYRELFVPSLDELVDKSELIVIGHQAMEFKALFTQAKPGLRIFDCAGIGRDLPPRENYEGICW